MTKTNSEDPQDTIQDPVQGPQTGTAEASAAQPPGEAEPEIIDAEQIVDLEAALNEAEEAAGIDFEIDDDVGEEVGPEERIQILEAQVSDLNDKLLRSMAEMENVRRRAQREKEDASKYAIANFAKEMLVVSDNMTRAFASVEGDGKGVHAPADELVTQFQAFIDGVKMTETDLMKTMEKLGLQKIEPIGQRFDANLHEALFEFEDKDQPAGTVAQVLEQGFTLNGRLLRAAKVGITKGGPKGAAAKPAEQPAAEEPAAPDTQAAYDAKGREPGSQINEEL